MSCPASLSPASSWPPPVSRHFLRLPLAEAANGKMMATEQVLNGFGCTGANVSPGLKWTDPPAGASLYEGMPDAPGGLRNVNGLLNGKVGQPVGSGVAKGELGSNIYRADPSGRVDQVISEEAFGGVQP